jgi:C1A family cysteine protease
MPILRSYGRKKPAPLQPYRMLTRIAEVPATADIRKFDGPIKNQGDLGSCTGHAFSSSIEWIFRAYLGSAPILSPLYLYVKELDFDGNFPNDDGSDGTTGCTVCIANGCCEDSLYPDSSQTIQQTTPAMDQNAAKYTLGAYHGLMGSAVAISVLGDAVPWPVQMGFDVMASFESDEVAQTGVYNPQPGESVVGGHEIKASAYDVGNTPTLRPANCPPAVLFQNSWGTDWGLSGYVWIPLSVLDAADTDLKIVHSGSPWV